MKIKTLVVEDSPMNQIFLSIILKKNNCDVKVAKNGFEAIENAKKNLYDIIFMDINMPYLSGIDATISIRNTDDSLNHKTPIILQSSMQITDYSFYTEIGFSDVISKMYSETEIKHIINKYVSNFNP